ncbi:MAG: carboxymuconolactone decarboxylase family protein, partial [Actinomycetota bacterium]
MARLRGIPRAEAAPSVLPLYDLMFGSRDPVAEPGTATGAPGDWWTVFARVPAIFDHCVSGFALYQDPQRRLPAPLRELGQTRAGWVVGSRFVFSQHCKSCRSAGVAEEKIAAIPHWEVATVFAPGERAVLAYTDALTAGQGRVPDGVFAELRNHLDEEQILELTYITALYAMHAVMSRALRTEFDDVDD